jgi:predicted HAD superfamily phosphohydrolase YqeG
MKTIKARELEVPVGVIAEVAEILGDNGIKNRILGVDEDLDNILIEIKYDKDDEDERQTVHDIDDVINDYEDDDDDNSKDD